MYHMRTFNKKMFVKKKSCAGFAPSQVLTAIALLTIITGVVVIAINPIKQFGEAQNAQRRSDVTSTLDAVHQYRIDNFGRLPSGSIISSATTCDDATDICRPGVVCGGVSLDALLANGSYLTHIPADPTSADESVTGYRIFQNSSGKIDICAPTTYGNVEIRVLH